MQVARRITIISLILAFGIVAAWFIFYNSHSDGVAILSEPDVDLHDNTLPNLNSDSDPSVRADVLDSGTQTSAVARVASSDDESGAESDSDKTEVRSPDRDKVVASPAVPINNEVDQPNDPLAKFPVVDQEVKVLGNGRELHVYLHKVDADGSFRLIREERTMETDDQGKPCVFSRKVVAADHFILTATSMKERGRIESLLTQAGWRVSHKSRFKPSLRVFIIGNTLDELAQSKQALLKVLPATASLTEDGVSWTAVLPNDTNYGSLWGMPKIQANKAWDIADAAGGVLIGICDSGVQYNHPDLAANMWVNSLEIAGNGTDDDGNGYVDDVYGYDFHNDDSDPSDDNNHGTHVAGTAAAVGFNSTGVIGVAPRAKIVACKIAGSDGWGYFSTFDEAKYYLTALRNRGEFVASYNFSMGPGGGDNASDQNAYNNGIVSCWAAGNDSENITDPGYYRVALAPYILYVANSTSSDVLWSTSNRGELWCDLAAPGYFIYSTYPGSTYGYMTGTSMATPHVAGAAAMVAAANRSLNPAQIMAIITNSTDHIAAFDGYLTSAGRLNVYKAVQMAKTYPHVYLLSPGDGTTLKRNTAYTLVAGTQIASNTVTAVRFYRGGSTLIGTDSDGSDGWTCSWTPANGTYDLTCEADDNLGRTTKTWWRSRVTVVSTVSGTPVASISATDDFGGEPTNGAKMVVQLSMLSTTNITIPISVSGTASSGADYAALPSSVVVTGGLLYAEIPVAVVNDFVEEATETVTVTLGSGTGYTVGTASNATIWIHDDESESPPVVITDPTNVVAGIGDIVNFSISVGGKTPFTYQWKKDGVAISGANASSYTISAMTATNVGTYSCQVDNAYGSDVSAGATLTLSPISTMPASDFSAGSAKLNALLSISNMSVDVYAYWNTSDGGTSEAAWTNSAHAGTWSSGGVLESNISYQVSGLQGDTDYYFTFACTNGAGLTWSSRVLSFHTMGAVAVDNSTGATNVAYGVSQLRGNLTAGGSGDIYYYWGVSDGGTNATSWDHVVVESDVLQGAFSMNVSNLLYGLTYHYRCMASNDVGTAWAPSSMTFTSMSAAGPLASSISNSPATDINDNSASLNGILSCSGAVYAVYAHWATSPGGTNASAWANSSYMGTCTNVNNFAIGHTVTGLYPATTYYFTLRGSNACEEIWATNVLNFETTATPTQPTVNNVDPTDPTVDGCTLNGQLAEGSIADVWICWGEEDAGSLSTSDWDHVVSVGWKSEGAPFNAIAGGLSNNVTYWYRCYVTNSAGTDWSDTATSFSALPAGGAGGGGTLATGGTITNYTLNDTDYVLHVFTNNGTFTPLYGISTVEVLVLGGGGAGARGGAFGTPGSGGGSPGGGAGGLCYVTNYAVTTYVGVTVNVGQGAPVTTAIGNGANGSNSVFGEIIAYGGQGAQYMANSGGNQGGFSTNGGVTTNAGFLGGTGSGATGGAGAGENGRNGVYSGAYGGSGVSNNISGAFVSYGGGGSAGYLGHNLGHGQYYGGGEGSQLESNDPGTSGVAGLGGGGGGGRSANGGGGGSGIVMVRYPAVSSDKIMNKSPIGITEAGAVYNAELCAQSGEYDVYAHWDVEDRGTNDTWIYNAYVGSWTNVSSTNISYAATNLVAGTTCYYTFSASNDQVVVWAEPSWQFTTTGVNSNNVILTVFSAHGGASPGTTITTNGAELTCAVVNSPVELSGTTQYVCSGWAMTGNEPYSGSATNFALTLTNNATLTWNWQTQYWLDTVAGVNGAVDVDDQWVNSGDNVIITATPDTGCHFVSWLGDTNGCTIDGVEITAPMTVSRQITANFAIDTFTVTFDEGAHGTRTGGGALVQTVDYDASAVEPEITPEFAWNFDGWSGSFSNVVSDVTVTALYSAVVLDVPVVTNAAGASDLTQSGAVLHGELTQGLYADVWLCWGDNDAGITGTSAWDQVTGIGQVNQGAPFSLSVSNLLPDTVYYYRCLATNEAGSAWSTSVFSFSTLIDNAIRKIPYKDSFEAYTMSSSLIGTNGWLAGTETAILVTNGNPTVEQNGWQAYSTEKVLPLQSSNHTQVVKLSPDAGDITNKYVESTAPQIWVDMMIQPNRMPEGYVPSIVETNIRARLYFNSDGYIVNYCEDPVSHTNIWNVNSGLSIDSNAWVRLTVSMDYSEAYGVDYYSILLDGVPISSSVACVNTTEESPALGGRWFVAANLTDTGPKSNLDEVVFSGPCYLDDYVVDTNAVNFGANLLTLTVVSAHGGASPGTIVTTNGAELACAVVNSPFENGTTQYVCTGWAMTGNEPYSGTTTNFAMTLTNNATLTWQWATNYWIELNTIEN